jgi:hypothetical protein
VSGEDSKATDDRELVATYHGSSEEDNDAQKDFSVTDVKGLQRNLHSQEVKHRSKRLDGVQQQNKVINNYLCQISETTKNNRQSNIGRKPTTAAAGTRYRGLNGSMREFTQVGAKEWQLQ